MGRAVEVPAKAKQKCSLEKKITVRFVNVIHQCVCVCVSVCLSLSPCPGITRMHSCAGLLCGGRAGGGGE